MPSTASITFTANVTGLPEGVDILSLTLSNSTAYVTKRDVVVNSATPVSTQVIQPTTNARFILFLPESTNPHPYRVGYGRTAAQSTAATTAAGSQLLSSNGVFFAQMSSATTNCYAYWTTVAAATIASMRIATW